MRSDLAASEAELAELAASLAPAEATPSLPGEARELLQGLFTEAQRCHPGFSDLFERLQGIAASIGTLAGAATASQAVAEAPAAKAPVEVEASFEPNKEDIDRTLRHLGIDPDTLDDDKRDGAARVLVDRERSPRGSLGRKKATGAEDGGSSG